MDSLLMLDNKFKRLFIKYYFRLQMIDSCLESQAVLTLLHLGDQDSTDQPKQCFILPSIAILSEKAHAAKSNIATCANISRFRNASKVKTEESNEVIRDTHNKENLKTILAKLKSSPSPRSIALQKWAVPEAKKGKTTSCELRQVATVEVTVRSFTRKMVSGDSKKDEIMDLVKAKIVEKLRMLESKKMERNVYPQNCKLSTLREMPKMRRGQRALRTGKRETQKSSVILQRFPAKVKQLLGYKNKEDSLKHLLL